MKLFKTCALSSFLLWISLPAYDHPPGLKYLCLQNVVKSIHEKIDLQDPFHIMLEKSLGDFDNCSKELQQDIQETFARNFFSELLHVFKVYKANPQTTSISFQPNRNLLFSTSGYSIFSYNFDSLKLASFNCNPTRVRVGGHLAPVDPSVPLALGFSPTGEFYFFGMCRGCLGVKSENTGNISYFQVSENPITHIIPVSDSSLYFIAGGLLYRGNLCCPNKMCTRKILEETVTAFAYSHYNKLRAVGFENGTVMLFKNGLGKNGRLQLNAHKDKILNIFLTANLLVSHSHRKITWWNLAHFENELDEAYCIKPSRSDIDFSSCAVSFDGKWLAHTQNNILRIYSTDLQQEVGELVFERPLAQITFDPQGKYLAIADVKGLASVVKIPSSYNFGQIIFLAALHKFISQEEATKMEIDNLKEVLNRAPDGLFDPWIIKGLKRKIHEDLCKKRMNLIARQFMHMKDSLVSCGANKEYQELEEN